MSFDVVITVGHSERAQGATSYNGATEWVWNSLLAKYLQVDLERIGYTVDVLYRRWDLPYSKAMPELVSRVNARKPKVAIELHFNATANHLAFGSEALHWPSSAKGEALAEVLSAAMAGAIYTKNRGAVAQGRSWNTPTSSTDGMTKTTTPAPAGPPLYFLQDTACPAVIVESHFGDNPGDHRAATKARDDGRLSHDMAVAIDGWIKGAGASRG